MPVHSSTLNSVQKACRILKALTDPKTRRLTEIATSTGLNKVTTLRLLESLATEGLIHRDEATKTYTYGDEAFIVAIALRRRRDLREAARPSMLRLASLSDDTVILSVQSGTEAVCIDREEGSFPIRANHLEVGSRRPLGVGAGSLALLAWLSDPEFQAVVESVRNRLKAYPALTIRRIEEEVIATRSRGYAMLLDAVHKGLGAIGVPILGTDGRPVAALSVAGLSERIAAGETKLVQALQEEVRTIGAALATCAGKAAR